MQLRYLFAGILLCGISSAWGQTTSSASQALLAKYEQHQNDLSQSAFSAPIWLTAEASSKDAQGEVYALFNTPFDKLGEILSQSSHWCELAILHINIKTCTYGNDQVHLYVGRKHYQTPSEAFPVQYRFQQLAFDADYLHIRLDAPEGPFGTNDYLITLEAIPIDGQRSFIRFHYRYRFGLMARMAMNTYLTTLGNDKVGFTVTGTDTQGQPVYVKGLQGVVERNVMRYLIAIQSVLDASDIPVQQRYQTELNKWYENTLKYPRQLAELERAEYFANKQRELSNQQHMQLSGQQTALN